MKLSNKERKESQVGRKRMQRFNQLIWLTKNTPYRSAEAVISAAIRGECTITFNRQQAEKETK